MYVLTSLIKTMFFGRYVCKYVRRTDPSGGAMASLRTTPLRAYLSGDIRTYIRM